MEEDGGTEGLNATPGMQVHAREGRWCRAAHRPQGGSRSGGGPRKDQRVGEWEEGGVGVCPESSTTVACCGDGQSPQGKAPVWGGRVWTFPCRHWGATEGFRAGRCPGQREQSTEAWREGPGAGLQEGARPARQRGCRGEKQDSVR